MKQYINIAKYKGKLFVREFYNNKEMIHSHFPTYEIYTTAKGKTEYQNFYQNGYVEQHTFKSSSEFRDFLELQKISNSELWGNIDQVINYITYGNYDTFDFSNLIYSILDIEVLTRIKDSSGNWIDGGFPNQHDAIYPINAICDWRSNDKKYHVFSTAPWKIEKSKLQYADEVEYHFCKSEKELLQKWILFYTEHYPHIISGWNVENFDIVYLVNRINKVFTHPSEIHSKFNIQKYTDPKDPNISASVLSPHGIVETKTVKNAFGSYDSIYNILGITVLDYLELYKRYRYKPREKYTLDFISKCELENEHKLEFNGTHGTLYWDDPQFFIDYNIQDVRCIVLFEQLFQFINLAVYISYFAGTNFADSASPIKIWETLIYNTALKNNIIVPYRIETPHRESYEGAYVHDPVPGLKGAVASFDFSSLYPSIIMSFYTGADVIQTGDNKTKLYNEFINILRNDPSAKEMLDEIELTGIFNNFFINNKMPQSVTKFLKKRNVCLTTNCEFFDVSKDSIFVGLVHTLFKERKADKKTSFAHKHNAQNIKEELEKRGITV